MFEKMGIYNFNERKKKIEENLKSAGIGRYKIIASEYISNNFKPMNILIKSPYSGYKGKYNTRGYRIAHDEVKTLFSNLSIQRARNVMNNYKRIHEVNPVIYNNYITGGYNTRAGLFRTSEKKLDRIREISRSHADYLGQEVDSKTDHFNRVRMRNFV